MSCAHCSAPLDDGRFLNLNLGAMERRADGSAFMMADDAPVVIFLDASVHDHDLREGVLHVDLLEGVPVVNAQAEFEFCSKTCAKAWFAERIDRLADPTHGR